MPVEDFDDPLGVERRGVAQPASCSARAAVVMEHAGGAPDQAADGMGGDEQESRRAGRDVVETWPVPTTTRSWSTT
jgi:hypothetical protein